jgi:hypothetical protein
LHHTSIRYRRLIVHAEGTYFTMTSLPHIFSRVANNNPTEGICRFPKNVLLARPTWNPGTWEYSPEGTGMCQGCVGKVCITIVSVLDAGHSSPCHCIIPI